MIFLASGVLQVGAMYYSFQQHDEDVLRGVGVPVLLYNTVCRVLQTEQYILPCKRPVDVFVHTCDKHTISRSLGKVKLAQARIVIAWVTSCEVLVMKATIFVFHHSTLHFLPFCHLSSL